MGPQPNPFARRNPGLKKRGLGHPLEVWSVRLYFRQRLASGGCSLASIQWRPKLQLVQILRSQQLLKLWRSAQYREILVFIEAFPILEPFIHGLT